MQDRYAGDIGDYSKLGLLRGLFPVERHRIGLVWYLYPDEQHNDDGRHTAYLDRPQLCAADPPLARALRRVVASGRRSARAIERAGMLGRAARYFDERLAPTPVDAAGRRAWREGWLERAVAAVDGCDVVCLDPDNGLEIRSVAKTSRSAGKYAFHDEVRRFAAGGRTLVIYQHFDRQRSHTAQLDRRLAALRRLVGPRPALLGLRFRAYSPRAYLIVAPSCHAAKARSRVAAFLRSGWAPMWDPAVAMR